MSKLALGITGVGGIAGIGGVVAYQNGLFSSSNKQVSVRAHLVKEGYELVNSDEQFKSFFSEFKADGEFMKEINKYKKEGETLEGDNGDKGKVALRALCSSYFDSKNNLSKAIKWCVLRVQDTSLQSGKQWIAMESNDSNKSDWESVFTKSKDKLIEYKVTGISNNTEASTGYTQVKTWCSENKKKPINHKNKEVLSNAIDWCTK
ncbi:hypothetical protein MHC_01545 [Mycoplasma haemocanis str. Illinois]|uniref:Uncharacterized protein n=1 Tax=Mycoplasma haemocanis (strain Illinois) TaxID=1111676 RepID=H6N6A3_MYCHN|nr:hypothetical protein [Mycoplasma haemocanis]AEW45175.1 hypothetical protein MHC_01545 [Mycoplasma haemocanis str. Illinois]